MTDIDDIALKQIESRCTLPDSRRTCDRCGKPNANTYPEEGGRYHVHCMPPAGDIRQIARDREADAVERAERLERSIQRSHGK